MTEQKARNECKGCARLSSIISHIIEKIREIDATSGEACYDLCQLVQRRMGDVKARNGASKKRSVNPKHTNRKPSG